MNITKHAEDRMKERLGISRHSCQRIAEKAWNEGKRNHELCGKFRKYIDALTFKNEELANIRVYGMFVYVFSNQGESLITVHDIDRKMRHNAENQIKRF